MQGNCIFTLISVLELEKTPHIASFYRLCLASKTALLILNIIEIRTTGVIFLSKQKFRTVSEEPEGTC